MSILSEAWRRAHGGDARLSKTLGAPAVSLRQRSPLLPWLLCVLLVALVVGLGVYIWLDQSRPPPAAALAASAVMPNGNNRAEGASQGKAASPLPAKLKVARPRASRIPPAVKRQTMTVESAATSPAVAGNSGAQGRHEVPTQKVAGGDASPSLPPRPPVEQAEATPPPEPMALAAAPDAIRTAFPSLDIDVHVWNADPASRFIVIGAQQFRAGDEIAPDVRLLEVTRSGEIVGFRGYRLVLP